MVINFIFSAVIVKSMADLWAPGLLTSWYTAELEGATSISGHSPKGSTIRQHILRLPSY
jgi:hypothetical protein